MTIAECIAGRTFPIHLRRGDELRVFQVWSVHVGLGLADGYYLGTNRATVEARIPRKASETLMGDDSWTIASEKLPEEVIAYGQWREGDPEHYTYPWYLRHAFLNHPEVVHWIICFPDTHEGREAAAAYGRSRISRPD